MTKLKQVRLDRGMTLLEVSMASGVAFSYISSLERGHQKNPTLAIARALACTFDLTVDQLFPEKQIWKNQN